jgi:hypothetical protein
MDTVAPTIPLFADAAGAPVPHEAYLATLADVVGAAPGFPGLFFTSERLDLHGLANPHTSPRWRSMAVFLADTAWCAMADGDVAQGTVEGLTYDGQPAGDWEASLSRGDRFVLPSPRPFHGDFEGRRSALSFSMDTLANGVVLSQPKERLAAPTEEGQQRACKQAIQFLCSTVAASYPTPQDVPLHTDFSFSLVVAMAGASHAIAVAGRCSRVS